MRDDVRAYLRAESARRERAAAFFKDVPGVDDDLGESVLDAHIAAAERLDPTQAANSLLIVRLSGEGVIDGWIDRDTQEDILGPLTQEVEYAAPASVRDDVKLGLVGVGSGSVLMHYRPKNAARPAASGELPIEVHPADSAVLRVSELHDMLETEALPALITSAFKADQAVLRQTRKLVEALDKHGVSLSTRWWGSTAARRKSSLTRRGQAHGLRLFAAEEQDETAQVQGLVTGLELAGIVTVTGSAGNKYRVDVGPDLVSSDEFSLGNRVHLLTVRSQEVDAVGVTQGWPHYKYIRNLSEPGLNGMI
ncbi:hypothetical protein [Microbacterium wangruii]|uniref:hypothetical protein n=1 Tax=Microbacterium wangruii TaxID=3049073 RepID=UPI00256F197C|nr:hypothetical protein [Microbacterium sp. zg-Y1211]MDL5487929.1 hypothetical protein [Microbacterium sp. zg-Y1211]